jgi:hypothetical protein
METRQIKINGHSQIETLKIDILQKLKLIDYKRNSLTEFESRLKSYLQRNRNLKIEFILNNTEFENDLKFDLNLKNIDNNHYPENYEIGNPHNRWIHDNWPLTQKENKIEDEKTKQDIEEAIAEFNSFFEWLELLGDGQIKIKKSK